MMGTYSDTYSVTSYSPSPTDTFSPLSSIPPDSKSDQWEDLDPNTMKI